MAKESLRGLATEKVNAASTALDTKSPLEIATLMNTEDAKVARAVRRALPKIAAAIERIAEALAGGGRLIYVGAGTSGRIAALDAVEMPPTFGTAPERVQFVLAGGAPALAFAGESFEDLAEVGRRDMHARGVTRRDVVVAVAASGRTPYTVAAFEYARSRRAATIAVTCTAGSKLAAAADIAIEVITGPEVVAGSTRLKAGTAEKMVLNMLSTGAMARLGQVYGNLMVNLRLANEKLTERGLAMLQTAAGCTRDAAEAALDASGQQLPVALVMLKTGASRAEATRRLRHSKGNVREAIKDASSR